MAGIPVKSFYSQSRQKHGPGRVSMSKAEQLLNAIVDNSDIEDLSDGEDGDPAVEEYIPCNLLVSDLRPVEQHPNDSPESDSDEDYVPPDAAESDHHFSEDSNSDNESEPQRHVHKHGRKPQRVENDECDLGELGRGKPMAGPRNGREQLWKSAPFTPDLVQFQGEDDKPDDRADWQPLDYVEQYMETELMKLLADCTNATSLANSGRYLNTSVDEMYHFFGAAIMMSCVPYPQTKMFWSNALRIPAISDTMTRDRFFKLRSHLKVIIDDDISEDKRKTDKFWKVRPFMDRILNGCRLQARPECVSIDEQMIPFTGACPFRQYVPLKPNPIGMKNFVLASADGIVLDFDVYQGAKALGPQVPNTEGLGLGTLVTARLSETLHPGTKVYCDRFFTSITAVDHMLDKQVYLTGTVMKNRVPKALEKLPSDQTMKEQGRGSLASVTRGDGKLCVVKWYDNKPVVMLSVVHAEQPEDTCQRWSKKEKQYVTVRRPSIVCEYNSKMGGVDLADRMMSYYRMSVRTKKWTIRMLMHFTDLALANSWLLYRRDNQENGTPRRAIKKFLEFRMEVAQVFLNKCDTHVAGAEEENAHRPQPSKRSRVTPVPHVSVRTTSAVHLPEMVDLKNPMRCRGQGCSGKSRVRCMTCNVFLCLQSGRNCYAAFHLGK
ncbi:piggyBac transposable element-derived protein 3 [Trichomycterus rosablanca]|uniref:piggyBac transposable element-derived protein 3 n=1 Tax=Trichomycterus rosablanca TaxID=2290929 RepID=UPI002F35C0DE